jgi:hypothetical protein
MSKSIIAAIGLLALAGCAGAPAPGASVTVSSAGVSTTPPVASAPAAPSDPLAQLASFTMADLQAADADAKAQTPPDQTAYQCYDYLIAVLPQIKLPNGGSTVGAILAFQRGRDLANGLNASQGALKSLNLACAPLVIDAQTTLNKLLAVGGGAAVGTGVGLPLLPPL